MKILIALTMLVAAAGAAQAQAVKIDRYDLQEFGVYRQETEVKVIKNPNISAGQTLLYNVKLQRQTSSVELGERTLFGIGGVLVGKPNNAKKSLRIVWYYPAPGLTNPATGVTKMSDEYMDEFTVGAFRNLFWTVGQEWQRVPGTWTIEVWDGGRQLVRREFDVTR